MLSITRQWEGLGKWMQCVCARALPALEKKGRDRVPLFSVPWALVSGTHGEISLPNGPTGSKEMKGLPPGSSGAFPCCFSLHPSASSPKSKRSSRAWLKSQSPGSLAQLFSSESTIRETRRCLLSLCASNTCVLFALWLVTKEQKGWFVFVIGSRWT